MPRRSTIEEERDLLINFTSRMLNKLVANRDSKIHWLECDKHDLLDGLDRNLDILVEQVCHRPVVNKAEVRMRCANIANFAAMIADRYKE
jgi:hypothetical protein